MLSDDDCLLDESTSSDRPDTLPRATALTGASAGRPASPPPVCQLVELAPPLRPECQRPLSGWSVALRLKIPSMKARLSMAGIPTFSSCGVRRERSGKEEVTTETLHRNLAGTSPSGKAVLRDPAGGETRRRHPTRRDKSHLGPYRRTSTCSQLGVPTTGRWFQFLKRSLRRSRPGVPPLWTPQVACPQRLG